MKRLVIFAGSVFLLLGQLSFADTAGPRFPGTGANGGGAGSNWVDPDLVSYEDYASATSTMPGSMGGYGFTQALKATQFGFSIPTNAAILGIQVTVGRYASNPNSLRDRSLYLVTAIGETGANGGDPSTYWPDAEEAATYGGASDLWGTTWTAAQINASAFGVALAVNNTALIYSNTAYVDYIQITVTYLTSVPIQLASFAAARRVNGIELKWSTVSEVNNYGFYIERRAEGQAEFTELANVFIYGHGTTLEPQSYSYTDNSAAPGVWYYRLRQVDLDGSVNHTDAVRAELVVTGVTENVPKEFALHQNYPNPFNPSTTIKYELPKASQVNLSVFDILGREVSVLENGEQEAGYHEVRFDGRTLSSGVYFYRLQAGTFVETKCLLILR